MKKSMLKVVVPVIFAGTVEVEVPSGIPQKRREALARKVALARVLATTENPDAPEDDARVEYGAEFGLGEATAGRDWDGCVTTGVSGKWSLQPDADDLAAAVERLASKADSAGVQPEELDETVHELASSVAADINNGGLEDQIRYLVEGLGAKYAEARLDDLIEDHAEQPEEGE